MIDFGNSLLDVRCNLIMSIFQETDYKIFNDHRFIDE